MAITTRDPLLEQEMHLLNLSEDAACQAVHPARLYCESCAKLSTWRWEAELAVTRNPPNIATSVDLQAIERDLRVSIKGEARFASQD